MTLLHPVASLKAALRANLLADSGINAACAGAVHDAPPRGLAPPYLVLGDATARANDTSDAEGRIIDIDIVIITEERGSLAALTLAGQIEIRLNNAALALDGHQLILLTLRETQIRQDIARSLTRATLKYRAFTEPL